MFDMHTFIVETNKIDPQYDESGTLIPGANPGDPMYDNHVNAFEYIPQTRTTSTVDLVKDIHRELTRGISIYEDRGNSGRFRQCSVTIAGQTAPNPYVAEELIRTVLQSAMYRISAIEIYNRDLRKSPQDALDLAWWCHNLFECAHPFVDGNGRTGRVLLNEVLRRLGHERIVIYDKDKEEYYRRIQYFRDNEFPEILATRKSRYG